MKKKISYLFMVALLALSLIMPCVADEPTTDLATEITTELVTEVLEETPADTTPEETSAVEETTPVVTTEPEVTTPIVTENDAPAETEPDVPLEEEWEMFKAKITDSATWTMIGTGILTAIVVIGTVAKKYGSIIQVFVQMFGKSKDGKTVHESIDGVKDQVKDVLDPEMQKINEKLERTEVALATAEDNNQKLYTMLILFMTNCKIGDSAKSEILTIATGIKKYSGNVDEIVAQAQEVIDANVEDNQRNAPPTPTLDQMLEEDYMELG